MRILIDEVLSPLLCFAFAALARGCFSEGALWFRLEGWRRSVALYFVVSRGRLDSKQSQKKGGGLWGWSDGLRVSPLPRFGHAR